MEITECLFHFKSKYTVSSQMISSENTGVGHHLILDGQQKVVDVIEEFEPKMGLIIDETELFHQMLPEYWLLRGGWGGGGDKRSNYSNYVAMLKELKKKCVNWKIGKFNLLFGNSNTVKSNITCIIRQHIWMLIYTYMDI